MSTTLIPMYSDNVASVHHGRRSSILSRVGAGIRAVLEASGRARAHRHLLDFAAGCESLQPDLARELRAAANQGPLS